MAMDAAIHQRTQVEDVVLPLWPLAATEMEKCTEECRPVVTVQLGILGNKFVGSPESIEGFANRCNV